MRAVLAFVDKKYLMLVGVLGSILVSMWTLARFFNEPSIYDLVYQQVVARVAVDGGGFNATVGATHYILKIFLVYIPFDLLHLDPRLSLILMTLLINVGSFILIALAIRSILRQLGVFNERGFVVAMLWFAAMAGSIFWIEFANSRNLEIAAGLWMVAISLLFMRRPSVKTAVVLVLVSTLAFFMDPLQVYMTAVPLVFYVLFVAYYRKKVPQTYKQIVLYISMLIVGYIVSWVLMKIVLTLTGLTLLDTQSSSAGVTDVLGHLRDALGGLLQSNIRLIGGYVEDGGRIKQLFMLGSVAIILVLWLYGAFRKRLKAELVIYVSIFAVSIEGVYLLSGQSLNGDTSRYLIMLAPVLALLIATLPGDKVRVYLYSSLIVGIAWSAIWVGISVVRTEPFAQDAHLKVVNHYVESTFAKDESVQFFSSMDTALTTTYYYRKTPVIPLACDNGTLKKVKLSYDPNSIHTQASAKQTAIILDDAGTVTNYPQTCTKADIIGQFGPVESTDFLPNGWQVLFFKTIQL